ncbi:MAG TPA: phage major capsid protein [Patescibacteria group bacterium]|nr:phage major capsid protein [Patescibacteria group bacterium]
MKTITQLKDELKQLLKASADIDAKATAENRGLLEAEKSLKNQLLDKVEEIQDEIKVREREIRIADAINQPGDAMTVPKTERVDMGRDSRSKDKFGSLGENVAAMINASRPGGTFDPRLHNAATGMGETVPSDGGYLLQKDYADKLTENLFDNSLILGKCERIPISANSNSITINGYDETSRASNTFGGITIYNNDEADEKTASKPKFRQVELKLKKYIGLVYLTDELRLDVPAMEARISNAFGSAYDFKVQGDLVNGTGANNMLGVMNAGSLVPVPKEAGQNADTIHAENIVKMYSRRFAAQTANYAWYYNQDIEPQLFTMTIAAGTAGIPVFMPAGGLNNAPYNTILGRPAYAIEQCSTLGDKGDIILANFKDGYIVAEKGGMQSDVSIHVKFVNDETVLRFVLRLDGQPWRATPLTPHKGSNTLSHFITLDARA